MTMNAVASPFQGILIPSLVPFHNYKYHLWTLFLTKNTVLVSFHDFKYHLWSLFMTTNIVAGPFLWLQIPPLFPSMTKNNFSCPFSCLRILSHVPFHDYNTVLWLRIPSLVPPHDYKYRLWSLLMTMNTCSVHFSWIWIPSLVLFHD